MAANDAAVCASKDGLTRREANFRVRVVAKRGGKKLRTYRCRHCGKYHVSSNLEVRRGDNQ